MASIHNWNVVPRIGVPDVWEACLQTKVNVPTTSTKHVRLSVHLDGGRGIVDVERLVATKLAVLRRHLKQHIRRDLR